MSKMDQSGKAILKRAESDLRALMTRQLEVQQYVEVAATAKLAEGVACLLGNVATAPRGLFEQTKRAGKRNKAAKGGKSKYPHFFRDGDQVVKVGWSKKHKREYSHKAPFHAVKAFSNHLLTAVSEGEVFKMENVLPIMDQDGSEVPAYQSYLTLKWLQHGGAVEKIGRDGYVLDHGLVANGGIDELIKSTCTRSSSASNAKKS